MLVWSCFEYRYIDPGRLFDDRYEVGQWLYAKMMIMAEPCRGGTPLGFSAQGSLPPRQTVAGMAWSAR